MLSSMSSRGGLAGVGGYSSMVELQPSKMMMRVRSPLPAPARLAIMDESVKVIGVFGVRGETDRMGITNRSQATSCGKPKQLAHIAQLVEHFLGKEEATGSSPVVSTKGQGCIASGMPPLHNIMRDSSRN